MTLDKRIELFSQLGLFLRQFVDNKKDDGLSHLNSVFYDSFINLMNKVQHSNAFFTYDSVVNAVSGIIKFLDIETLKTWTGKYEIVDNIESKKLGLILAGNIPLVGFHDVLSVILAGHIAKTKFSSKDDKLMQIIRKILIEIDTTFADRWIVVDGKLDDFNAMIATGSNNSGRYFDYYFGRYPHIFRNNRNAIAVLNGSETKDDLRLLADDVFMFFGLGCRNVSKIFVPEGYNFDLMINAFEKYNHYFNYHKYVNNYEYQRAILLLNQEPHYDSGFLLLKEDIGISSPIGVLYYEKYKNIATVADRIKIEQDKIQCVVSNENIVSDVIAIGQAQYPEAWDYADNIDTMEFLINL
ncbi:MAG: hypothetical protein KAI79_10405 [Bacteroidales bacterium]|nr:hypothetical protein [Bacteroidales bacterium]